MRRMDLWGQALGWICVQGLGFRVKGLGFTSQGFIVQTVLDLANPDTTAYTPIKNFKDR